MIPAKSRADSSSDSELHHPLEVTFGGDDNHRRRASVIAPENPYQSDAQQRLDVTSCFVHSLLGAPVESASQLEQVGEIGRKKAKNRDEDDITVVQSRQLTKKQLSDMAWNVRTLSKRLGSLKLKLNVKGIFILTKKDHCIVGLTRELARWLLHQEGQYVVFLEKRLENNEQLDAAGLFREMPSAEGRLKYLDLDHVDQRSHSIDFIVTLGGDGTVLYSSWLFQQVVPPVLSFALGSLGFLTKFDFHNYQNTLVAAFCEGITVSLRLRLECTIMRAKEQSAGTTGTRDLVDELVGAESKHNITHEPEKTFQILNEVVVDRGPNPTMSSLEIFGDDQYFTSIQADGVCIATPTGSTAYNLAAGGSLSHPENPVVLLTAICAHTLNFRPIILPDTIVLRVGVPYDARTSSWVSFDGRQRLELHTGDYVTVTASRFPFANVMPSKRTHDWIESISRTLNWNTRQKPTAPCEENEHHI